MESRFSRMQRGQSLIELAFALPIFLVIVMGAVDFGWGIRSWISATNAAREAARYGVVTCAAGEATAADVQQRAIDSASGLNLEAADITVTNCAPGTFTESLLVEIDFEHELITPLGGMAKFLGGGIPETISIHSKADLRIE